ncbi:hypothetical protein F2P56_026659 [Juglans regia]|uniref:(+)-neomenthol dehydrogenase-like n=1 Tax=Juglans regia TaxID=51240 RepID=A0A833T2I4_JUGRE|nr:hypothetical protein F2P56_026659 [Juglans regia]
MTEPTPLRYAVVTGGNKGIGLGICRELASKGVMVVLTARDEKKGLEAVEQLIKESASLSGHLVFHQLDVVDPLSVTSLADFIQTKFGKLDILVRFLTHTCKNAIFLVSGCLTFLFVFFPFQVLKF